MKSLKIIRAGLKDIDLAMNAVQNIHNRHGATISTMQAFLQRSDYILLLAFKENVVIGSLNGYSLGHPDKLSPQFLLYEVDVLPQYRKKGVGSALVNSFIELAHHSQAFEVWVLTNESNQAAMRMYLKCGFQQKNKDDVMLSIMLRKC